MKPCPCGSGQPRREKKDGYGIFLTFVCDRCETKKMAEFRSDIRQRYQTDEQVEPDY
jgi:hypothetical protein